MRRLASLPVLLALAVPAAAQSPDAPSPLDGEWRGRSDGGSCNAPLDYILTIESGIVDGSAFDTTAHGPVPNLRKAPEPAPGPGLWQIHGLARGGSFSLMTVASVKGTEHRAGKLSVNASGGALTVTEAGGCGRKAALVRK